MSRAVYFLISIVLASGAVCCSQNPQAASNQEAGNGSIFISDESLKEVYSLNLLNGDITTLIAQGINSQPIDLKVAGNFLYILQSAGSPCSVIKYDLASAEFTGGTVALDSGSAQQMAGDGTDLFTCDLEGYITKITMAGFSVSGSATLTEPAVQSIFFTNGNIYAGISEGESGNYASSKVAVLASGNIGASPAYYNSLPNPGCITTDGEGNIFIACAGTEDANYNYNNDGGIQILSGSVMSNIVTGKSYASGGVNNEIKYCNGNIYAAENIYAPGSTQGIDVYMPDGAFITNILPGTTINCMLYVDGSLFAEGNNGNNRQCTMYKINVSDYSVSEKYPLGTYEDSWGSAIEFYP